MSEAKRRGTAARREPVAAAMTLTQAIRLSPETATILELEQARHELAEAIATLRSHEEDHGALLRHWRRISALLYLKGAYDSEADNLSTPAYDPKALKVS